MTQQRQIDLQRQTLVEIRNIMNSMKTLAYLETRKLIRFINAQQSVVAHIDTVARDFFSFYQELLPQNNNSVSLFLLLGTEQGFCGDFNASLLNKLELYIDENKIENPQLIVTGRKLAMHLEQDPRMVTSHEGATVADEVERVLNRIITNLVAIQAQHKSASFTVLYHDSFKERISIETLLPPFEQYKNITPQFSHPPLINLKPEVFFAELLDHYLFSALHEIMYISLMAENLQRVQHLEGAVHHLDKKSEVLLRKSNVLRQEEITEEIEVILLNATNLEQKARKKI
jgi:F-type H+-transporting ATPase subunit gamma